MNVPLLGAQKHDTAKKWRPELIAPEFIMAVAYVLTFGAVKYSAGNWRKGMKWSRAYGALQRHLALWAGGEKYDEETGYSHLWHAGCCLMFLITYEWRGIGEDDRTAVGLSDPQEEHEDLI